MPSSDLDDFATAPGWIRDNNSAAKPAVPNWFWTLGAPWLDAAFGRHPATRKSGVTLVSAAPGPIQPVGVKAMCFVIVSVPAYSLWVSNDSDNGWVA